MAPSPDIGALRVLLAEDNHINQMLLKAYLKKHGCEPIVVTNGQDAVAATQRERFDVIIMDLSMPLLSGLDAARQIRASEDAEARVPIIALTANAPAFSARDTAEAGMNGFLTKPVTEKELVAEIRRVWSDQAWQAREATTADTGEPPLIARDQLDELFGSLPQTSVCRMVTAAMEDMRVRLPGLEAAMASGDARRVRDEAHAFAGSTVFIGAEALRVCSVAAENAARGGNLAEAERLLKRLPELIARTRAHLEEANLIDPDPAHTPPQ